MRRKPEPEHPANHERWLVSYGDLLTLLFAVFVVLYAMSHSDKKKLEEVQTSMRESFGYFKGSSGNSPSLIKSGSIGIIPDLKPMLIPERLRSYANSSDYRKIKTSIDDYLVKTGNIEKIRVKLSKRGVVISLKEAGVFDSGSAALKIESLPILTRIAETLNHYDNIFRIEGHTDNVPIQSVEFRSNWELSIARALNVVHFLTESGGISPDSISATGYGEYRPATNNETQEGKARNRRVDIVVLAREAELYEPVTR